MLQQHNTPALMAGGNVKYENVFLEMERWKVGDARAQQRAELERHASTGQGVSFTLGDDHDSFSMAVVTGLRLCLMRADPVTDADLFCFARKLLHQSQWCDVISFRASVEQDSDFIGRLYRSTVGEIGNDGWINVLMRYGFTYGERDRVNAGLFRIIDDNFDLYLKTMADSEHARWDLVDVLWGKGMDGRLRDLQKVNQDISDHVQRRIQMLESGSAFRHNEPLDYFHLIKEDLESITQGSYFQSTQEDDYDFFANNDAANKGFQSASWKKFDKELFSHVMFRSLLDEQKAKKNNGFATCIARVSEWMHDWAYVSPYRGRMYAAPSAVRGSWYFFSKELLHDRMSGRDGYRMIVTGNRLIRGCCWPCGWSGKYPEGRYKLFRYEMSALSAP